MPNIFSSLLQRAGRRKLHADLLRLDDHLLRDIGLTRGDIDDMITGHGRQPKRTHG